LSTQLSTGQVENKPGQPSQILTLIISLLIIAVLSFGAWWFTRSFPLLFTGNLKRTLQTIEAPVYAIILGLLANGILSLFGLRDRLAGAFRTELFLKTGIVLLGASLNLVDLVKIGLGGLLQASILITSVFFFTWYLASLFKVDQHVRALISASVSICGVSAAIAAAGAVQAKREQLGYVASLVIVFALPLIFIQPLLAHWLNLSQAVAGAWIGGNIDTSAAVAASGAIAGETALKYATVVKLSQNALIGVIAFLLALYWITRVEKDNTRERPHFSELFTRFPKFVIGFIAASIIVTLLINFHLLGTDAQVKAITTDLTSLRTWFFTLAFVSIGLSFQFAGFREAGWRPVAVYALATVFNTLIALLIAYIIFGLIGFK
jgi:uncharacterized integral membrane protein (TIGR00698 family)